MIINSTDNIDNIGMTMTNGTNIDRYLHLDTMITFHNDARTDMQLITLPTDCAFEYTGYDIQCVHQSSEHTIDTMMWYNTSRVDSYININDTVVSNKRDGISNVVNAPIDNNNSVSIQLFDERMPNYIVNIHEWTSRIKFNRNNTSVSHTDAEYKLTACIVTSDHVENNTDDTLYTNEFDYNDGLNAASTCTNNKCVNNAMVGTVDRLLKDNGIATKIRSWMLDRVQHGTNNNTMHVYEMEDCYLLGMTACYVPWSTMTRQLERIGSNHAIETRTTHRELDNAVYHSASRRGLGVIPGLWKTHGLNQLNDRMTKAYRRGVTCTRKYGFVWYPICTLIC